MMRKHKKGFTIVELVIVVAVIAVLTAVLVPTFIHLSSKAKDSIDKTVVKNANIQLAAKEGLEGKNRSMSDAVKDVDEIGYHIPGVSTGNGNKIVWDSVADRFVLLSESGEVMLKDSENVAADSKLFYAVSSLSERGNYAVYAKSDFEGSTSFEEPISFDAGDKEGISSISYSFTSAGDVLVATNSEHTVLTVNTPNAEFKHVGLCEKEVITAVKGSTFRDHGHVGFVEIAKGHYVADQGANIKAAYATTENAVIDKENGGIIDVACGNDAEYTGANSKGNVELSYNTNKDGVESQAIQNLDGEVNPKPAPAGSPISNFAELQAAFANGGDYYLTNTVLVTSGVATTKEVSIDFNGFYLNVDSQGYSSFGCVLVAQGSGSKLTIKDTSANGSGGIFNVSDSKNDAVVGIFSGGNLVIESGTILSTQNASIGGVGGFMGAAGSIIINGGTINGYIGSLVGTTIYVNTACSFRYISDEGISLAVFETTIVCGEGVTQVSGSIHSDDTTFVFTK